MVFITLLSLITSRLLLAPANTFWAVTAILFFIAPSVPSIKLREVVVGSNKCTPLLSRMYTCESSRAATWVGQLRSASWSLLNPFSFFNVSALAITSIPSSPPFWEMIYILLFAMNRSCDTTPKCVPFASKYASSVISFSGEMKMRELGGLPKLPSFRTKVPYLYLPYTVTGRFTLFSPTSVDTTRVT